MIPKYLCIIPREANMFHYIRDSNFLLYYKGNGNHLCNKLRRNKVKRYYLKNG